MLIASKIEDICSTKVNSFVYVTANSYTWRDIVNMEKNILYVLTYSFGNPTSLHFLHRLTTVLDVSDVQTHDQCFLKCKFSQVSEKVSVTAKFLMELFVQRHYTLKFLPSLVAESSLYLSEKVHHGIVCVSFCSMFVSVALKLFSFVRRAISGTTR